MSTESIFDQSALSNWVELCNEHGRLQSSGAAQELLAILRVQIILSMTDLLPNITNDERNALALLLLAPDTPTQDVDSTDPVHTDETVSVIDVNDEVDNIEED